MLKLITLQGLCAANETMSWLSGYKWTDRSVFAALLFHKVFENQAEVGLDKMVPLEGAAVDDISRQLNYSPAVPVAKIQ